MKTLWPTVFCLLMGGFLITACDAKKDPKMEEAGKIHLEAMAIEEGIAADIEAIDSLKTLLADKRKTLTATTAQATLDSTVAALDKVHEAFEAWEDNLIEVPGLAHEHHHGEGEEHHHDHKPAPDLTPEQMLDVQKEIKANIEKIKIDWEKAQTMMVRAMALK